MRENFFVDFGRGAQSAAKRADRWLSGNREEMRVTAAVRSAEAGQRYGCALQPAKCICPVMLMSLKIICIPDFIQMQDRTQIIDVPVRVWCNFHVVGNASFKASGAEGTADVNIVTGLKFKPAEFADLHLLIRSRFKDQGICTGPCLHI